MTLRQLAWMAAARKEHEGDLQAWLIQNLTAAVWSPKDLPERLNPFAEREVSEAMQRHRESWAARRWRVAAGG